MKCYKSLRVIGIIGLLIGLTGCGAYQMHSARSEVDTAYLPSNKKTTGAVQYLEMGASFVIRSRRDDAYRQMYEDCQGPYNLLSDERKVDGGQHWVYMTYECK